LYLLELASEYEIDYDIDPSDETILEKNINTLEHEIERMKSTLAWAWGRGDKREVVAEVERQTKLKIDDSDLPDEIKTTPKNPPLLT
jgi:acyl carrier protein